MNIYDPSIIHYSLYYCYDVPSDGTYGTLTRASGNIKDVTCTSCIHYYNHPEDRDRDLQMRIELAKFN